LESNTLDLMLNNLKNVDNTQIELIKTTVWTISNLFRGKPFPTKYLDTILPVIPHFFNSGIKDVITDSLWILSYVTDVKEEEHSRIDKVISLGIVPRIVAQFTTDQLKTHTPAIRVIGNICSGTEEQTQEVLKTNFLELVPDLLKNEKKIMRKETAWTISNIAAGTKYQIDKLFHRDIIGGLIECLNDSEYDVIRESCWAIFNMIEGSQIDQFEMLMSEQCLEALIDLFEYPDAKVLKIVLQTLESILEKGDEIAKQTEDVNPYVYLIETYDNALADLEELQNHKNEDIYELVTEILEVYFHAKDVEDVGVDMNFNFNN